jgi:uncharacterized protein (DUF305 family)
LKTFLKQAWMLALLLALDQSAIVMAQVALEKSKNPQIKELAENIISAQQREIDQMKQWRREWYPQS